MPIKRLTMAPTRLAKRGKTADIHGGLEPIGESRINPQLSGFLPAGGCGLEDRAGRQQGQGPRGVQDPHRAIAGRLHRLPRAVSEDGSLIVSACSSLARGRVVASTSAATGVVVAAAGSIAGRQTP